MSSESQKSESQRIDKWLLNARFFKTRTLASQIVSKKGVRVNGTKVTKPGRLVGIGDTLAFMQGHRL
ncbi:MAG: S4 domain-containing protein, partial [Pseudomonadota bacterium]